MNGVADTSWLIAHFNADDAFHEKARAEFAKAEVVHVPAAIWVEFLNVSQHRFDGQALACRAGQELRRARNVRIGTSVDDHSAQTIWRKYPALTYTDAVAVAEAQTLGFGLLSFEDRQHRALKAERQ
ncbi:MAG TPA: PIN domain-containing protein [Candidatus Thermoplasmatota archaeon]|nr:PIN domain-containing protein [Candidatus Thermoplasmatota archaeon]